ncbi:MAG: PhzF family phenazine biosynthesis protein [Phycisphaerae bacterium]
MIKHLPFYIVHAFVGQDLRGNPAGVCVLDHWPADSLLMYIAAENQLPETTFIVRHGEDFDIRWFTPITEVDLCGHGTLAAAWVVFHHLEMLANEITFKTMQAGELIATRKGEMICLDFPIREPVPELEEEVLADLKSVIGIQPIQTVRNRDLIAVLKTAQDVINVKPNLVKMLELPCIAVVVTAPGGDRCDFVSRFFAPSKGLDEDHVTGSAHCTLVPYWSQRLKKNTLHAIQVSPRGGELFCSIGSDRVLLSGRTRSYLKGELHVSWQEREAPLTTHTRAASHHQSSKAPHPNGH